MPDQPENRRTAVQGVFTEPVLNLEGKTILSRFSILGILGSGGFGTVFKARDLVLNKDVALKFLNPDIVRDSRRFHRVRREINISQKITDPRIVKIFSLEKYDGLSFLVMEYIEGKSLKEILLEKRALSWSEFRPVYMEILEAVGVLHSHGIIHRDLKPSNIFVTHGNRVKLLDFGLSKELTDMERTSSIGEIIGSPYYIAPEQLNKGITDLRSDIYQLGLILYRALSGKFPYRESSNTMEFMYRRIAENPERLVLPDGNVPGYVGFGISRSIERQMEDRFNDIGEMIAYFRKERYPLFGKFFHFIKKHAAASAAVLSGVALAALFAVFVIGDHSLSSVRSAGSGVTAYNRLGIRLWRKDYAPLSVNASFVQKSGLTSAAYQSENNINLDKKKIIVFLNESADLDPVPINSTEMDNKVSLLDEKGVEYFRQGFFSFFGVGKYDFFRKFYITQMEKADPDRNGKEALTMVIRHFRDMFPSAFVLIRDGKSFSFANPGSIFDYVFLRPGETHTRILMTGMNNILSHLYFAAEVQFPQHADFTVRQTSIPNLITSDRFLPDFLCFIPKFSELDHSGWDDSGIVVIRDYHSGNRIRISRDYTMAVEAQEKTSVYRDQKEVLFRIYILLNDYYAERILNRNPEKAYRIIQRCLGFPVGNPFLRSAMLFFKADSEIFLGMNEEAQSSLRQSLDLHPNNPDSAQRLCEMIFLSGDPGSAYETARTEFGHINNFWGLSSGEEIFKAYCRIQSGDFSKAREIFSRSVFKSDLGQSSYLTGILNLFTGDYDEAFRILKQIERLRIFTVAEIRLLRGRSMILAGKELSKAAFFFNDLSENSLTFSHLAKMSAYYLGALKGDAGLDPGKITAELDNIIRQSSADFFTRFWLFYDAFMYAKTMEILGNRKEAERGYRLSIQANPYTAIAAESKENLSRLR